MKKTVLIIVIFFTYHIVKAQCAMCKAVVESGEVSQAEGLNSGILYLSDAISANIDYFEVNTSAFPSTGGTNIIFGRPRNFNGNIRKIILIWIRWLQKAK